MVSLEGQKSSSELSTCKQECAAALFFLAIWIRGFCSGGGPLDPDWKATVLKLIRKDNGGSHSRSNSHACVGTPTSAELIDKNSSATLRADVLLADTIIDISAQPE